MTQASIGSKSGLENLLTGTPSLWKGRRSNHAQTTLATGHKRLDRSLPGGGWPRGAVTEVISVHPGSGELSLLFPALANSSKQGRWLTLIDPPWVPYPAALHGQGLCLEHLLLIRTRDHTDSLWACEQALREIPEGIVLAWPEAIRFASLRRLQLAAKSQNAMAFMFRPGTAARQASPAALRLKLLNSTEGLQVDILKCRGHRPAEPVLLNQSRHQATPINEPPGQQIFVAGNTIAPSGTGLSYPRAQQRSRSRQHH